MKTELLIGILFVLIACVAVVGIFSAIATYKVAKTMEMIQKRINQIQFGDSESDRN